MKPPEPHFFAQELRPGLFLISAPEWEQPTSTVNCWLVVGKEQALLVDAGLPCTGLRAFAELTAEHPVRLVLTHGHFDHAGALAEFDTFSMNPADESLLHGGAGLPATKYNGTLLPLRPGDTVELGSRTLLVYGVQGHTKGSLVLLDTATHTLLSGDSVARRGLFPTPRELPLVRYFDDLLRLESLDFDGVASAHDRFLLPKNQIRYFICGMLRGIQNPDGEWELPSGESFVSIHAGDGVEDPDYLSISLPQADLPLVRQELCDWQKDHPDFESLIY